LPIDKKAEKIANAKGTFELQDCKGKCDQKKQSEKIN
jgi:hypothetical protein